MICFSVRPDQNDATTQLVTHASQMNVLAGAILLAPLTAQALAEKPIWHLGNIGVYAFAGLTVAGMAFSWWGEFISDVFGRKGTWLR
jgi:hypothetical protein